VVDVESGTVVKSWSFGEQAQVGNVWSKAGEIVSLSINGELTVLDQRSDKPVRVLHGRAFTSTLPCTDDVVTNQKLTGSAL
jgi:hypothetical protein